MTHAWDSEGLSHGQNLAWLARGRPDSLRPNARRISYASRPHSCLNQTARVAIGPAPCARCESPSGAKECLGFIAAFATKRVGWSTISLRLALARRAGFLFDPVKARGASLRFFACDEISDGARRDGYIVQPSDISPASATRPAGKIEAMSSDAVPIRRRKPRRCMQTPCSISRSDGWSKFSVATRRKNASKSSESTVIPSDEFPSARPLGPPTTASRQATCERNRLRNPAGWKPSRHPPAFKANAHGRILPGGQPPELAR